MEIFGANPVDVVVLVVVLASALLALMRGFVAELFTLIGLSAASAAVLYGMPSVQPYFEEYLGKGLLAKGATAGALFFGTIAITSAFSYVISRQVRQTNLSAVDRSLGFLFGIGRGSLIVCLLFICITFVFPPPKGGEEVKPNSMQSVIMEARTTPALAAGARLLASFAPNHGVTLEGLTSEVPHNPLAGFLAPKSSSANGLNAEQLTKAAQDMLKDGQNTLKEQMPQQ